MAEPQPRIEDYGLIGNTHTGALVSNKASIDWFCAPRFDSPASVHLVVRTQVHEDPRVAIPAEADTEVVLYSH